MWIELALRWVHVIGATVLLGTGAGIAFFMVMAHQTCSAPLIAHTAKIVVRADWLFTASAVLIQPITGLALAYFVGWRLTEPWILISMGLYVLTGAFWLPVVWIQGELRKLAQSAAERGEALPGRYHRLYRIWFVCGFPAFISVLAILWLMIARPSWG